MKKSKIESTLKELNAELKELGMLELQIVNPLDCLPQAVNARYMTPEIMQQLTENIKNDGHLESTPLVYKDEDLEGKYRIISGHHRIDAAKAAGLEKILVMVTEPESIDDIVMKQLAHNALIGIDDKTLLQELFNSITEVSKKIATGLADEIGSISYTSLNFRLGTFKEFTILFLPEDLDEYDKTMERMEEVSYETSVKPSTSVRLSSLDYYNDFKKAIIKIKKVENIKSNGVALMRLVELAKNELDRRIKENGKLEVNAV